MESHLNFKTLQNETFQSIPELSGTCRSRFDVHLISSITREDFSNVYKCSGLQALFVTVFYTSVDLLCKNSYKSSSLLGYFDIFQSNHTVGCCNINFRSLCQKQREKNCFASSVSIFLLYFFWATAVVSLPRLANFSPCDPLIFCFSPTLYAHSLLKIEFFSNAHGNF